VRKVLGHVIKPIHVLGFARGGSTIIAELIAESIKATILCEPFQRGRKAYKPFKINWGWEKYIPKHISDLDTICNGVFNLNVEF